MEFEGRPVSDPDQMQVSEYRTVLPGYFETIGVPLVAGRTLTDADRSGAPRTMVVNAALARLGWPNESAIGRRIRFDDEWYEVVGVVGDIHNAGLDAAPQPTLFVSAYQENPSSQRFVVRSTTPVETIAPAIRAAIGAVDPAVPVTAIDAMPELVARSIAEPRYRTVLVALFGVVAAVLATIGVYGVTARAVSQQSREIGIRMALGSSGGSVIRLFVSRTMTGVAAGVAVGLVGAFAASRLLAPYLFGVRPGDPLTFTGVLTLLVLVGIAASWLPARVASRTNPAVVLRRM